jgi:fengycin family lipopeptide synthetase D
VSAQNVWKNTESAMFWLEALQGSLSATFDTKRGRNEFAIGRDGRQTKVHEYCLDKVLTEQLRQAAQANKVSLHNYLLACFTVLMSKYENGDKAAIGTQLSGRDHKTFVSSIGPYTATVPVVFEIYKDAPVKEHIHKVTDFLAGACDHQNFGFYNMVSVSGIRPDPYGSKHPLFDIMFVAQNPVPSSRLGSVSDGLRAQERFDATFKATIHEDRISIRTTYKGGLYDKAVFDLLALQFQDVLRQIVQNDRMLIRDVNMLTEQHLELMSQYRRYKLSRYVPLVMRRYYDRCKKRVKDFWRSVSERDLW